MHTATLALLTLGSSLLAAPPPDPIAKDLKPFLAKHCYACHGGGKKKGGVALDKYTDEASIRKDRKNWEHFLDILKAGEMPPRERPQPTEAELAGAVAAIDAALNRIDCSGVREVGRVTLRRLNRAEYDNTIRDLVGVDFEPAADFPPDDVGYGFDNIGDVLTMSPLLLEKYLGAAESILERAIVKTDPPKASKSRLNGLRVTIGAGDLPRKGAPFLHAKGDVSGFTAFEAGDYILRAEVAAEPAGDEPVRGVLRLGQKELQTFTVPGKKTITVETKLRLPAGSNRVAVAFLNPFTEPKTDKAPEKKRLLLVRSIEIDGPHDPPPVVLPETHRKIMTHGANLAPREAAREIVSRFATKAFRRPVTPDEVDRLLTLYDRATKEGERFEQAVKLALYRVLVSPHFLFRVELDPPGAEPGKAYPISEHALASRLSYFLWSSMPDDELFALAEKGKLRAELEPQLRRMLKDPKSDAFVRNFSGQWLTLRSLANVAPDPKVFPQFDNALRTAMVRETELFFEAILREDRSILDFLDADFSFVNGRLAKHYGIPGIEGKTFQKVKLPANRGGILTHASILTLTSYPTRTSPVQRGKWVLEQLLDSPLPPPPPDVPDLGDDKELKGSLRTVMEMHRSKPICASCHQRMDPIGFAFENYDAIGAWREKDGKFAIDASGILPDGKSFQGPAGLRAILKEKKELFGRSLTEKIMTYALGRGMEHYDKCAVDKVLAALEKNDHRFSTLLLEVVRSEPFQMRTAMKGDRK